MKSEDSNKRKELLIQARIAEKSINKHRILNLSGTKADLDSPDYIHLKKQLAAIHSANPECRFIYIIGKRPDGKFFFFLDSEPADSPDYSPPGQVFDEISSVSQGVFITGEEAVEGPQVDRWGRWVSALVPITHPETGRVIATLGMDIDARTWMKTIFYRSLLPVIFLVFIFALAWVFLYIQQRNILERRKILGMQLVLQKSENKYRVLFLSSRDAIMILVPPLWKFTSANPAMLEMFKIKDEKELLSFGPWDLSPLKQPDGRLSLDKAKEMINLALRKGSHSFEWLHKRLDGDEFFAIVLLTKMELSGETILQATVRDITDLKRAQDELQTTLKEISKSREALVVLLEDNNKIRKDLERKIEELKRSQEMLIKTEKLASLGRLLAEIAHEVNNPLMIISGNAQLALMSGPLNAEVKNNLDIVIEESQKAKNMIRQLLKFARPSKGEIKNVDINQSLDKVVSILEKQFKLANVEIKKEYGDKLPLIPIDEELMHEVFLNLINNAKESMPNGGVITIRTYIEYGYLYIDFKDTGSGMSDEIKQRLFEPFVTTKEEGTGLGLGICYGIVKAHNGDLRFESQVDKGTTATIVLPVK